MRTEPARAGPSRCGGPGQHGSARVYTTIITNQAGPVTSARVNGVLENIFNKLSLDRADDYLFDTDINMHF